MLWLKVCVWDTITLSLSSGQGMLESDLLVDNSQGRSKQLQAKTGLEMSVLDCSLTLEKLREYNAFSIPLGTE